MKPTYRAYEDRKLGGHGNSLRGMGYMLRQAFFANSFGQFWQRWNPLFSYYLLYSCYRPLSNFLPRSVAVILTFAVSGAVHDLAASLAIRALSVQFTATFVAWGGVVVLEEGLRIRSRGLPLWMRPVYHLALIVGAFWGVNACLEAMGQ